MGYFPKRLDRALWQTWITPAEALLRAKVVINSDYAAQQLIISLFSDGEIRAAAESLLVIPDIEAETRVSFAEIAHPHWRFISGGATGTPLWSTFSAEMSINRGNTRLKYYGIRIDPDGLAKKLPIPAQPPSPPPNAQGPASTDLPGTTAHIALSQKALEVWYEAYKLAYPNSERRLDHAWERVKAAFPERSVTRARVRELMAGGKPGPKGQKDQ